MIKKEKQVLSSLIKKYSNNQEVLRLLDLYIRKMAEDVETDLLEGQTDHFIDHQQKKIQGVIQFRIALENDIEEEEEEL